MTSLAANGVKPGANVYAELGSTWRFLMRDPDSAAHALGKHLKADKVARERENYAGRADPTFLTHGPKTRREFLALRSWGA